MHMQKTIICFNLGAQAERVSKYDKGYIAEDISAEAMYECIMEFYNKKFIHWQNKIIIIEYINISIFGGINEKDSYRFYINK